MDRRSVTSEPGGFLNGLEKGEGEEYDDRIEVAGKTYRMPYKIIKEATFSNLDPSELKDIPHCARLQYRLLLLDPVLKAKAEFIRNRVTVTYNPPEAKNRKEKISRDELIGLIEKEGVHIKPSGISERDVDYFEEIYKYQSEPATIREHAPYAYTLNEWRKIKPEWAQNQAKNISEKYAKFRSWQNSYLGQHSELTKKYGYKPNPEQQNRPSLIDRIIGRGKKEGEKSFWFHGV